MRLFAAILEELFGDKKEIRTKKVKKSNKAKSKSKRKK